MTKDQYEKNYATQKSISVERMRLLGYRVSPCNCGGKNCEGWEMLFPVGSESQCFRHEHQMTAQRRLQLEAERKEQEN